MAKVVTTVKILDSNYKIACPGDEAEAVKQAAVFLDKKLREIKEGSDLDEKKISTCYQNNIGDNNYCTTIKLIMIS